MSNNDEWIRYSREPVRDGDAAAHGGMWGRGLAMCRPVYPAELEAGLRADPDAPARPAGEGPEITLLADALWRVRDSLRARMTFTSLEEAVSFHIGEGYYDCMSEGMPRYECAVLRLVCEVFAVPRGLAVYPGKEDADGPLWEGEGDDPGAPDLSGWYTVGDFLDDMGGQPGAAEASATLGALLASVPGLRLLPADGAGIE